jgi:2-desacetyl-2-hydroxyethyl bacteriochlorophyllide A dehydrogenase
MKALIVEAAERYSVVEVPDPVPAADEAVVRVMAAGICGTDIGIIRGTNPLAAYPLVPGHECVGVVESAPTSSAVRPGEWVTIYPSIGCGTCPACRAGRINHCPTFRLSGLSEPRGVFADKIAVRVAQLLPVPDKLRNENGAVVEPTAVGVHVVRRAGPLSGQKTVVIGSGVIGLLVAQVARAGGAAEVVLVDRLESRQAMAGRLGFDRFIRSSGEGLANSVQDLTGGAVHAVFDTVCSDTTIGAAIDLLLPGGRLVTVASPHGADHRLAVPYAKVYRRELSLIASRNYVPDDFVEAMRLIAAGQVDAAAMVTAAYPLAEFGRAYADLTSHPEVHLKVLLRP